MKVKGLEKWGDSLIENKLDNGNTIYYVEKNGMYFEDPILRGDFMDKQLEKSLKVLSWFNRPHSLNTLIFDDKIFVHNDIMYSTDGKIFCWTENQTDIKDFCFFKGKKFDFYDPKVQEVKEDNKALQSGDKLERIIKQFNYYPLEFDVDFSDYPLPLKLMDSWKNRYFNNSLFLNFETAEATFKFCGGEDEPGGVTAIYGDIVKNITGKKTDKIGFPMWYILKVMDVLKVKKIHFKCYPERRHLSFKVGNYNFLATTYN